MDRRLNAALMDAAVENRELLAKILGKYGEITVHHDDKIATKAKSISDRLFRNAIQTILSSREQDLIKRINGIIDTVISYDNISGDRRQEENNFNSVTRSRSSNTQKIVQKRRSIKRETSHVLDPSVTVESLMIRAALGGIVNRQRVKQTDRDSRNRHGYV
ncbi:hypothetical protein ACFLV5_03045 [Chloroflexota bacterium]